MKELDKFSEEHSNELNLNNNSTQHTHDLDIGTILIITDNLIFCLSSIGLVELLKNEYKKVADEYFENYDEDVLEIRINKDFISREIENILFTKYNQEVNSIKNSLNYLLSSIKASQTRNIDNKYIEDKINEFVNRIISEFENKLIINIKKDLVPGRIFVYIFNMFDRTLSRIISNNPSYKVKLSSIYDEIINLFWKLMDVNIDFVYEITDRFALYVSKEKDKEIIYSKKIVEFKGKKVRDYINIKRKNEKNLNMSIFIKNLNYVLSILFDSNAFVDLKVIGRTIITKNDFFNSFSNKLHNIIDYLILHNSNTTIHVPNDDLKSIILMHVANIISESVSALRFYRIERMHRVGNYVYPVFDVDEIKYYNNSVDNKNNSSNNFTVFIFVNTDLYRKEKIIYIPEALYNSMIDHLTNKLKIGIKNIKEDKIEEIMKLLFECKIVTPKVYSVEAKKLAKEYDKTTEILDKKVSSLKSHKLVAMNIEGLLNIDHKKIKEADAILLGTNSEEYNKMKEEKLKNAEQHVEQYINSLYNSDNNNEQNDQ
ncbi:MAG: hypothetical protein QXW35_02900 [Candidatus Aenigmatarchaeota archaeon]